MPAGAPASAELSNGIWRGVRTRAKNLAITLPPLTRRSFDMSINLTVER